MPLHEIQVHSPKSSCPTCSHNLPTQVFLLHKHEKKLTILPSAQLMELHHLFFHPKKEVETAECTLEENVEGIQEELGKQNQGEGADDVCQLCDQPLPPPISLADHLLAEHDVSISLFFPSLE